MADTTARQPAQVTPPPLPGLNSLVTLITGVVVVAALYLGREVLVPITLAILLSFVLSPIVALLRRIHVPQIPSVLVAVVIGLGAIGVLVGIIGLQIAGLAGDVPRYAATIETKATALQGATLGRLRSMTERIGEHMKPEGTNAPEAAATAASPDGAKPTTVEVRQPPSTPLEIARNVLEPVLKPIESALIIFIVAVFILMQKEDLRDRMIRLAGSGDLHRTTVAMDDAGHRLSKYFLAQVGINTVFGAVIGIGLYFIGVPSALLWGILAGILRFVPYVGAVLAAALPLALAAAVDPGWSLVIWTAGLFLISETITGQVVEPLIYGHSTGLSPAAVVIAAIFWSWIWGPIGLILSTPLTLCLVVLGRYVDRLEFLDVLLGDRPALTPVENFYQRMLADDPDEALQQAELLLKERSLTTYYDEVVLKGLQLAANDASRGVLQDDRIDNIRMSVRHLVEDLGHHDDRDPHPEEKAAAAGVTSKAERDVPAPNAIDATPPAEDELAPQWQVEAPVLCLAGRGPLDEAVSAILGQLLDKHGLGSRMAAHDLASRDGIRSLDLGDTAMICVSYLDLNNNPAALHYLVRRLKARAPNVSILVGLWPADAKVLQDERLRSVIGADHFTTSLRETVETCVAVAHQKAAETRASGAIQAVA
ncbi:AI-2E family transporter [Lichenihabitans sp. Uapishka_5]|uniref:AI-2E family transporter n=1 Tax=Lichenihabitans sp. Uapishka_5 TaxID=3037302 RepID=UPI0029E81087|nr:AI-2E family transporter [Lichenihabitans sp. Uapishka_5]MDX7950027.1 AI-2E family transporter [Lichenihabitans sp. Uapishka_5]